MINNIEILKRDLPLIYDVNNFLVKPEKYHPDNPKYAKQWNLYKKHCIEGLWSYDKYGWRFMPPTLFSYGNFFKMEDQEGKQRVTKRPRVRDLDWLIHYSYLEALGFSGFANDEKYCSDECLVNKDLFDSIKHSYRPDDKARFLNLYRSNGTFKEYAPIRQYLKELNPQENLGKPLYNNQSSNLMIFGNRGGGKSYSVAGIVCQTMTFDGLKEYTQEAIDKNPKVNISIGAAIGDKSAELVSKIVTNMELLGTDPDFGAYGTPGELDFIPGPFYVDWIGATKVNNADNPYRYEYRVETPSGWQTLGSRTKLVHVNYSEKKASGAQSAAGSRNAINIYEEVGLMPNFIDALLSNEATVSKDQERFGVQIALGTSGNIDLVQQSKKVFNSPKTYSFLEFDNLWEPSDSKIGLFIPAYLCNDRFKDENGNTKIEDALKFFVQRREEALQKDDVEIIRAEKMNHPLVPSDMWVSSKGSYFPVTELLDVEQELVRNQKYKKIGKPVSLVWDSSRQYGVRADIDENAEPYYNFPFDRSMSKPDGCFMIYEEPQTIKGLIPDDMYIYTLDPYVAENIDEGGSIGCFQIWLNRKYTREGFNGDQLVATYYGKNPNGKDAFYEICEKGIAYYGNCPRMFWYEANRGDSVRGYFIRKNKTHLLCLRPTREKGSAAKERQVLEFGYTVPNRLDKINMITDAAEWLLSFTQRGGKQVRVYETLPCLFTVQQLIQYTLDGNFDAASALLGLPLALKEFEHQMVYQEEKKARKNRLSFLSVNPNIFNAHTK